MEELSTFAYTVNQNVYCLSITEKEIFFQLAHSFYQLNVISVLLNLNEIYSFTVAHQNHSIQILVNCSQSILMRF